jgi:Xaa-Pro aminopeptidase
MARKKNFQNITKLRDLLKFHGWDYLLLNSNDEFLLQCSEPYRCSRYWITGFSGSTGDALLSSHQVFQFVDGRYYQQAEREVGDWVDVVKISMDDRYIDRLLEHMEANSTLAIVSTKISLNFFVELRKMADCKGINISAISNDPVDKLHNRVACDGIDWVRRIPTEISGMSADDKIEKCMHNLKHNQAYLETNLVNIAYLTNLRQYQLPFQSTFRSKLLITREKAILHSDDKVEIPGKNFEIRPMGSWKDSLKNLDIFYIPENINYDDLTSCFYSLHPKTSPISIQKHPEIEATKIPYYIDDSIILPSGFFLRH